MAEEISGEGFLNLLDTKITPLSGGDEKITLADQLEKTLAPNAKSELSDLEQKAQTFESTTSREIFTAVARARGYSEPMKVATDQELDTIMMDGGTEVIRGANRESLEVLSSKEAGNVPSSAYNEGGDGLYTAIEAASPDTRARLGLPEKHDYSGEYYEKKSKNGAQMRAVLSADAKVVSYEEGQKISNEAAERVRLELSKMDQSDHRVQRGLKIFDAIEAVKNPQMQSSTGISTSPLGEILSGIDASAVSNNTNEVRLINRSVAVTSGVKTSEEMKKLYPQDPSLYKREQRGDSAYSGGARYGESLEDRYKMAQKRAGVISDPKTPVDLSKLGTKADIKTAVQRAEKISTGQGKGEALASMSYRATGGQAVREISEQIASKPSSTGRMVKAVSQASAAVAAGKSGAMRKLGALTTIFRGK